MVGGIAGPARALLTKKAVSLEWIFYFQLERLPPAYTPCNKMLVKNNQFRHGRVTALGGGLL